MVEIEGYHVFFTFEVTVKGCPANACLLYNVRYVYFFVGIFLHQFEKCLHNVVACVFLGSVICHTKPPFVSHLA